MEFLEILVIILFANILTLHVATALVNGTLRYVSAYGAVLLQLALLITQLIVGETLMNVAISIMISVLVYVGADFIAVKWVRPALYGRREEDARNDV